MTYDGPVYRKKHTKTGDFLSKKSSPQIGNSKSSFRPAYQIETGKESFKRSDLRHQSSPLKEKSLRLAHDLDSRTSSQVPYLKCRPLRSEDAMRQAVDRHIYEDDPSTKLEKIQASSRHSYEPSFKGNKGEVGKFQRTPMPNPYREPQQDQVDRRLRLLTQRMVKEADDFLQFK